MTDLEKVLSSLERLPIFPLPGAVLLPQAQVPLHIFEPRYRKMIKDALPENGGPGALALAQLAPSALRSGEEKPRILPIIGVGLIGKVEALADGRYNIVLRGVLRARVVEEHHSAEPYRLVRALELTDDPVEEQEQATRDAGESLRRLLLALCAARPGPGAQAVAQLSLRAQGPGQLADLVAAALLESPGERQAVLEALRLRVRLELVSQGVAALLAQVAPRTEGNARLLN